MRSRLCCLVLFMAVAIAPSVAAAGPACPASTIAFNFVPVSSTAGSRDTSTFGSCSESRGRYDLAIGVLVAEASHLCGSEAVEVSNSDEFVLAGIPPGTEVTLIAHLDASGGGMPAVPEQPSSMGSGAASISDGVASDGESASNGSFQRTLGIAVQARAGEPFLIHCRVSAAATDGWASARGALWFSGIPPGGVLTSCRGFSAGPVPARPASWGALKVSRR